MIEKILVAVDGSQHSTKAVKYAAEIASGVKPNVIVLYVMKTQNLPPELAQYANSEHMTGGNKDILKQLSKSLVDDARNHAIESGAKGATSEIIEGPVARTIVARAKHHAADMIVIGSRGMGNIEATLRGGVSHRVELLAKCPVLTVR